MIIFNVSYSLPRRRQWHPTPVLLPGKSHKRRAWWTVVHEVTKSQTRLSDFTFTFHFHALEKEMATHSSVLAWRIPGTEEPGRKPSMGLHRVRHYWSNLAAAAAATLYLAPERNSLKVNSYPSFTLSHCLPHRPSLSVWIFRYFFISINLFTYHFI